MDLSEIEPKTGAGLIRKHWDAIEQAQQSGATLKQIHAKLQADAGLQMTYRSFLRAVRMERQQQQPESAPEQDEPKQSFWKRIWQRK